MAKELCIYCNQRVADTRDHIPPKSVILEPYPPNLPTVPACAKCNHGFGKTTDTDFKLYLALMVATSHSPSIKQFLVSANRTLLKNKTKLEKIKKQVVTYSRKSDQFLMKVSKEDRDLHRKTLARIVKGLFYYHYKRVLPNNYQVRVFDLMKTHVGEIFPQMGVMPNKLVIHEEVFYAYHQEVLDRKGASLWELHFYNSYTVWAITGPNDLFNGYKEQK